MLAKHGNVSRAAKEIGVGRRTVYEWREKSARFAERWDDALDVYVDALEGEADRRAFKGVLKPVFQGGVKVGRVRQFSDRLLIVRLRALRPDVYRENATVEIGGHKGEPIKMYHVGPSTPAAVAEEYAAAIERVMKQTKEDATAEGGGDVG